MNRVLLPACALALLSSCIAPAYDASQYEAKVVQTAEEAVSALETVRLAVDAIDRHGLPGPPVEVAVSAQEDIIGSVSGTFSLVQPPDEATEALRDEVLRLLDDASSMIEDARIALRGDDVAGAVDAMRRARETSDDLDALATRFSP